MGHATDEQVIRPQPLPWIHLVKHPQQLRYCSFCEVAFGPHERLSSVGKKVSSMGTSMSSMGGSQDEESEEDEETRAAREIDEQLEVRRVSKPAVLFAYGGEK